jgi:hypothetical protein
MKYCGTEIGEECERRRIRRQEFVNREKSFLYERVSPLATLVRKYGTNLRRYRVGLVLNIAIVIDEAVFRIGVKIGIRHFALAVLVMKEDFLRDVLFIRS